MSSDKCPPIRLPIQIEASCGSNSHCNCVSSNCESSCSIADTESSQRSYQNKCDDDVKQKPTLAIAFLSNVRNNDYDTDLTITLNPTMLSWCDFLTLFYRSNHVFSINPTYSNFCAINFSNQTYENITKEAIRFNLPAQIRNAWATKCETLVENIPPKINMILNKELFGIKSLINSSSSVSLTLDQAINTLLENGEIAPGDSTTCANVRFIVQYKYYFKPLNTCVLVNFTFITNIPCYKNLNFCDNWCPPYSKDQNCRACHGFNGELEHIEEYLMKYKNGSDNMSIDDNSENSDNYENEEKMSTRSGKSHDDENTCVTMESSRW
jgi:hypothetical protein